MAKEEKRRRTEARLNTRENSTLVFATVAESASLLILTFALQGPDLSPIWHWIGFIFSLLGSGYREVTILTIDFLDHKEIKDEYPLWAILPRMLLLRFFLYLPIAAWIILLAGLTSSWLGTLLIALSAVTLSAMALSVVELLQRKRLNRQKEPANREIKEALPLKRKEDNVIWDFVFILFSVALSFSIYNANTARIVILGDFIYYIYGQKIFDSSRFWSTIIYLAGVVINLFIVAHIWKKKWIIKVNNFYVKTLFAFAVGVTPMALYYIMFFISKSLLGIPL